MSVLKYWVWLTSLRGIGPITVQRLLERFESPEDVFFARENDFRQVEGLTEGEISALSDKRLERVLATLETCYQSGYRILTMCDAEYPLRLRNIYDPPVILYVQGPLPRIDDEAAIAVVGTRRCTPYGIKTAERTGYEMAKAGLTVVSGLARGIDSAAARGALRAGGKVLGVVGTGLDIVYPPENRALFADVAATGAILSEYPPGAEADKRHFPQRNRILSGLSLGVVVIEAPEGSGALITAARALEQGRDVFAVPGNVDSEACRGSNGLLRDGAVPVTSGWDVADEYTALFPDRLGRSRRCDAVPLSPGQTKKLLKTELGDGDLRQLSTKKEIDKTNAVEYIDFNKLPEELAGDELAVASVLGHGEMQIDEIIELCGLPAARVLSALTLLEIKGHVTQRIGKRFLLNNPRK